MDTTRALLALIALSAAALVACAAPPAADTTAQIPATFMSFNIRTSSADDGDNAWPLRRALAAQVAGSQGPDVLGLQEAQPDQVAFLAEQLPAYRFLGRGREADAGAGEAVPLLYHAGRWALDETEHGTFWLSDTPDMPGSRSWGNFFPRIVTWARLVHHESGKALYVYNAHFDHESENARVQSSELLRRRIAARRHSDPVVVMGDFNAEPASAVLRTLIGSDGSLVDTYAVTSRQRGWRLRHLPRIHRRPRWPPDRLHPGVTAIRGAGRPDPVRRGQRALSLGSFPGDGDGGVLTRRSRLLERPTGATVTSARSCGARHTRSQARPACTRTATRSSGSIRRWRDRSCRRPRARPRRAGMVPRTSGA